MNIKIGKTAKKKYDKNLNFKTKKEYKGSLLKVLDNVLENAANYNDISAIIDGKSWERKETISYPGASLPEGIFNTFCHANYFIRSNVKVEFFEDKVKITNPSGVYQATLEQIMKQKIRISLVKNFLIQKFHC